MVHVTFYTTVSKPNVIVKSLTQQLVTTAELYDDTNIINPELKLAWSDNYATTYNYFYIQEFKRYYFIADIIAQPGGAVKLRGQLDVLYTYRETLGYTEVLVTRQYATPKYQPTYIKDPQFPVHPNRETHTYPLYESQVTFNLGTALPTNKNFVLNIMGRTPSSS